MSTIRPIATTPPRTHIQQKLPIGMKIPPLLFGEWLRPYCFGGGFCPDVIPLPCIPCIMFIMLMQLFM